MNLEEKIQKEIRRRVLDLADLKRQETAGKRYTRYTINALEEVTGLPRVELESIAREVRVSYGGGERDFFSIKSQLIISASICMPLLILIWLIIWSF